MIQRHTSAAADEKCALREERQQQDSGHNLRPPEALAREILAHEPEASVLPCRGCFWKSAMEEIKPTPSTEPDLNPADTPRPPLESSASPSFSTPAHSVFLG